MKNNINLKVIFTFDSVLCLSVYSWIIDATECQQPSRHIFSHLFVGGRLEKASKWTLE